MHDSGAVNTLGCTDPVHGIYLIEFPDNLNVGRVSEKKSSKPLAHLAGCNVRGFQCSDSDTSENTITLLIEAQLFRVTAASASTENASLSRPSILKQVATDLVSLLAHKQQSSNFRYS